MTGESRCCLRLALPAFSLLVASTATAEPRSVAELSALVDGGNWVGNRAAPPPFWETLGSLRSGRGNRSRLTWSADDSGVLPNVSTSARLRLELTLSGAGEGTVARLSDASSSLGVAWRVGAGTRLSITAHPFDTDYQRIGYLHALDWGGTQVERRESTFLAQKGGAPGVFFGVLRTRISLTAGLKWSTVEEGLAERKRLWGGLVRGSAALSASLRVDSGFGYFQRDVGFAEGASLRMVWHGGVEEPEVAAEPFRPPTLRDDPERLSAESPRGAALALEGAMLVLRAARERSLWTAPAAALYGSWRGVRAAVHAAFVWRSLSFVLRNDPSYSADPDVWGAAQQPELTAWVGGSLSLEPWGLVPSFEFGARLPSVLLTASGLPGVSQRWIAGAGESGLEPLPLGAGRQPLLAARLALRWQASASVGLCAALDYQRNPNRVRLAVLGATALRVFDAPDSLSGIAGLQARF